MKSFIGNIVGASSPGKTMDILCPDQDGVRGVVMGQRVLVIPIGNESCNEYGHLTRRLEKFNNWGELVEDGSSSKS